MTHQQSQRGASSSSGQYGLLAWMERTFEEMNEDRDDQERPACGLFTLTWDNRKKQARGYRIFECQGSLYESGHVHLDTMDLLVRDFLTFRQMQEYVSPFGRCSITWQMKEEGMRP